MTSLAFSSLVVGVLGCRHKGSYTAMVAPQAVTYLLLTPQA